MKPRRKKCQARNCRQWFDPWTTLQRACSLRCAIVVGEQDRKNAQRQKDRETREKLKTRSQWMKEAQQAFNAWVRHRDRGKPCISCGRYMRNDGLITGSRIDAGHYRSVGACPELRFCELNCHAQCAQCNRHGSGNVMDYRLNLIKRIGIKNVEWLEGPHMAKKYTIPELREIRNFYRRKVREAA